MRNSTRKLDCNEGFESSVLDCPIICRALKALSSFEFIKAVKGLNAEPNTINNAPILDLFFISKCYNIDEYVVMIEVV